MTNAGNNATNCRRNDKKQEKNAIFAKIICCFEKLNVTLQTEQIGTEKKKNKKITTESQKGFYEEKVTNTFGWHIPLLRNGFCPK